MRLLERLLTLAVMVTLCTVFTAVPALAQCEDEENDPIEDVAGVLDEDAGVLYTTAEEEADVAIALDAVVTGDGYAIERIAFDEETGKQESSTFHFAVVIVPWPGLFLPQQPLCQCASPFVVVYRHRRCRTVLPGFASGCRAFPGGSFRINRAPLRRCVTFAPWRYCVERNRPWHTVTVYADPFCQVASSVNTRCRFGC